MVLILIETRNFHCPLYEDILLDYIHRLNKTASEDAIQDEILKFEQTVSPLDKLIENNCSENIRLTQLRDSLLPKLMSGEIDVSNIEIDEILDNISTDKL